MKRIKDSRGFGTSTGLTRSRIEAYRKQTAKAIREHGRALIGVMEKEATAEDPETAPLFCYTLGNCLQESPYPEVWSCYPSMPSMKFVLNHLSDAIRDGEVEVTTTPIEVPGFLGADGEIPVRLRLLTPMERVVAYEQYTCQLPSAATPVVVAELPDTKGFFADDGRCHPEVREVMLQAPFRVHAPEVN